MPAGSGTLSTSPIFITSFSMVIWCTCTVLATGEATLSSLLSVLAVRIMKAPLDFWCGTVARAQASLTVVSAMAGKARPIRASAARVRLTGLRSINTPP
ncbi:hypothetical protein D9M71_662820 [compost metagenome]